MIPTSGQSIIDLHLNIARNSESSTYAEESLKTAEAMFSYTCAVNHISPSEYSNRLIETALIRAQRKNKQGERA